MLKLLFGFIFGLVKLLVGLGLWVDFVVGYFRFVLTSGLLYYDRVKFELEKIGFWLFWVQVVVPPRQINFGS